MLALQSLGELDKHSCYNNWLIFEALNKFIPLVG